ncbi:MAG: DUF1295 domain-containing protein [Firmicutes bacterium]|nr:DUF1295 domain-containing protein [Bacillota bacterium]
MFSYFLGVFLIVVLYFSVFFIIAQKHNNNSIVDIGWGLGFVVISLYSFIYVIFTSNLTLLQVVISLLITLWGLRLFLYISIRNFKKPEDFRYVEMRKKWEDKSPRLQAFFKVFMSQAFFMMIIAFPIYAAYTSKTTVHLTWIIVGGVLFLIGLLFEGIGDYQLRHFLSKPENKGHIMTSGLWKFTRHPNYFGETLIWWSLWVMVLSTTLGIIAIVSPLLISYLLLFVSGIPLLEKKYQNNPEFQEYAKKTSPFFPIPPKK